MEEADAAAAVAADEDVAIAGKVEVAVDAVEDADGAADEMTDGDVAAADGVVDVAAGAAAAVGDGAVGELGAGDLLDRNH